MTRLLFAALLLGLLSACIGRPADEATGQEIYLQLCANCHGESLQGALGPALGPESNSASQPDEFMRVAISQGRGRMPSFESSLTDDQVEVLIDFLNHEQGK
ncbi:MAG TPA: cytochrome c [Acidimicrobiia bacterium]|nr:cytochrome c [Acidimicrobiia bacterium]